MKEAFFTTEIVRSIRHHGGWAYKIPDAPITKEIMKITRFTAAKPCDIVSCIDSKFIAIETKQSKKWEALSVRDFRPEQITGMTNIVKSGKGRAFVFLNIRMKEPYENRLIIFDWAVWGERIQRESIKAKELKARIYYESFIVNDKRIFDLSEWLSLV
jgi:penicillin-binding protein-related factor A (putative recombinase)